MLVTDSPNFCSKLEILPILFTNFIKHMNLNSTVESRQFKELKIQKIIMEILKTEELIDENFLQGIIKKVETHRQSSRKYKIREKIVEYIKTHGKATAKDLSEFLHLSRNRCSEYLVEMEREGKLIGIRVNGKKYYGLKI